jgi:hypothetical protein
MLTGRHVFGTGNLLKSDQATPAPMSIDDSCIGISVATACERRYQKLSRACWDIVPPAGISTLLEVWRTVGVVEHYTPIRSTD